MSDEQVLEMHRRAMAGASPVELARRFGVTDFYVRLVMSGAGSGHLKLQWMEYRYIRPDWRWQAIGVTAPKKPAIRFHDLVKRGVDERKLTPGLIRFWAKRPLAELAAFLASAPMLPLGTPAEARRFRRWCRAAASEVVR